jgi:hypothetical protein
MHVQGVVWGMRAAMPYVVVLILIGLAIWFAVGNPLNHGN